MHLYRRPSAGPGSGPRDRVVSSPASIEVTTFGTNPRVDCERRSATGWPSFAPFRLSCGRSWLYGGDVTRMLVIDVPRIGQSHRDLDQAVGFNRIEALANIQQVRPGLPVISSRTATGLAPGL